MSKKFQKILDQFFFLRSNHILREKKYNMAGQALQKKFTLFFSWNFRNFVRIRGRKTPKIDQVRVDRLRQPATLVAA